MVAVTAGDDEASDMEKTGSICVWYDGRLVEAHHKQRLKMQSEE